MENATESAGRVVGSDYPHEIIPHYDALRAVWRRWRLAHGARPLAGSIILGGAALVLAAELGALELAIGALTAYTAYRMLRYGVDLRRALMDTIEIEKEVRDVV